MLAKHQKLWLSVVPRQMDWKETIDWGEGTTLTLDLNVARICQYLTLRTPLAHRESYFVDHCYKHSL